MFYKDTENKKKGFPYGKPFLINNMLNKLKSGSLDSKVSISWGSFL